MKMRMLRTREPTLLSAIERELWLVCAQIAFGRVLGPTLSRRKSAFGSVNGSSSEFLMLKWRRKFARPMSEAMVPSTNF